MNCDVAPASLARSLFAVVVLADRQAAGMGRIVGDGAIYYHIQDIAVIPEHQGRGLGARIMDALMAHIRRTAPDQAFVGLFASEGNTTFYERYGFATQPAPTGMFHVVHAE